MENSRSGYKVLLLQRTFFRPLLGVRCKETRLYCTHFNSVIYFVLYEVNVETVIELQCTSELEWMFRNYRLSTQATPYKISESWLRKISPWRT